MVLRGLVVVGCKGKAEDKAAPPAVGSGSGSAAAPAAAKLEHALAHFHRQVDQRCIGA